MIKQSRVSAEPASDSLQEMYITDVNGNLLDCVLVAANNNTSRTVETHCPELLDIQYLCPECGHEWEEQWDCACDSECPHCGLEAIIPLSFSECR
jgi:hypothetical protein